MNDHHRWMIRQSVEHIVLLDEQMEAAEERIMDAPEPFRRQLDLRCTIPGMKDLNAATILAEIGPDMSVFATAAKLCHWAGICPGNNITGGKRKSSISFHGNIY